MLFGSKLVNLKGTVVKKNDPGDTERGGSDA